MDKLKVLDLFSGIGGFSLGLERTGGFETVAFCEIEPFCQKVLKKHWPEVPCYEDVTKLTGEQLRRDGISIDVITGGFPCQDLSTAGHREGISGARSGLWAEYARLIGELQPQYAIMENVSGLLSGGRGLWFGRFLSDVATLGYDAEWHCIPAASVGAEHFRDRVWIIANPSKIGPVCYPSIFSKNPAKNRIERLPIEVLGAASSIGLLTREDMPDIREDDGLPLAACGIGALGNSVVPQIPELIGHAILEAEAML